VLRRHPNYIWEQLGDERLTASVISDGHHLPASVVRSIVRAKTPFRTIVTCDAAGLAGCAPGVYELGSGRFELLADGRIVIAGQNQLLAGSSASTETCVAKVMEFAGVSLREAIEMAGRNVSRLLGLPEIRLARGSRADLCVFHPPARGERWHVVATLAAGELRFGELPSHL
jgi:N-acetylglucosamine-6-phosphate deacetylase